MGICCFRQNFPTKCRHFETFELCEIKQQQKNKKQNKKIHGIRVPCKISHITQFSENQVSKQRHFSRQFQNKGILLHLLGKRDKCPFWPKILSYTSDKIF